MPDQPHSEKSVFLEAIEIPSATERAVYLDQACKDNPQLRAAVEALLRAHEQPQRLLDAPAAAPPAGDEPPVVERPGTVLGPYKLLEQIGEGGFGVVFMAEQQHPVRRKVALKVLKPGMDTRQVIARFEAERQALALMDHPHIAHVLDGGETAAGRPYFVMELVRGIPITDYCDQNQLTVRERLELLVSVCQAVQHAHQKGVIHRDLKAPNVLVTLHDGTPVVKVIDFGIAKAIGQQLTDKTLFTGFAQMVGTPLYMSPEQAGLSGLDVDTRSDIYSLGVLLYELLTGTTPFTQDRLKEVGYDELRRIIREEEPPKPSTRLSSVGPAAATVSTQRKCDPKRLRQLIRGELDWIVMKCLEKDRNRRYETANGLALDVQRYLHDEPVQACPPSVAYWLHKFVRRHQRGLIMSTVVVWACLLATGSLGWAVRDWAAREQQLVRDREARQAEIRREVTRTVEEARLLQNKGQWAEAWAAAQRAEGVLGTAEVDESLRRLVRDLLADLAEDQRDWRMLARLQEAMIQGLQVNDEGNRWMLDLSVPGYEAAFQEYGIDRESMPAQQAAQRIGNRPPRIQLVLLEALDRWRALESMDQKLSAYREKQAWFVDVIRAADADPWRARAREALYRKDFKTLAELAKSEELIKQAPHTMRVLADALSYSNAENLELAIRVLRRAQQLYPNDFLINARLGLCLSKTTPPQSEDAVRFSSIAVALQPDNPGARLNLGLALARNGKLDEAIAAYRKAIELKPDYAMAYYGLGHTFGKQGRLEEAIAAYHKAIELRSDYPEAHTNLGLILDQQGRSEEAVAALRKAIALKSDLAEAHHGLGVALYKQGQLDGAITAFRKVIKLNPDDAIAYSNLGNCLRAKGKMQEAIDACRKAIELKPDYAAAYSNLAVTLREQGKPEEAAAVYRKVIELKPHSAEIHCDLGNVLSEQGKLRGSDRGVS
jgi:serine/threonine protein kinase/tetratricopeptide (TPR) repeat protein